MSDFVHLHTHTHMSGFDGLGHAKDFVTKAAEMGHKSIAFTEHGSIRGLFRASQACDSAGVKLIPGCEFYFSDDASKKGLTSAEKKEFEERLGRDWKVAAKAEEQARRSRAHVTVWALNDEGLRNLYRLSAWSWTSGFYYKPRIDLERLKEFSAGLAVSTGCPGGIVPKAIRDGDFRLALDRMEFLAEVFGDRLYVEIMPHVPQGSEGVNQKLIKLARRFDARLVATQDAHYPRPEHAPAQEALLCIHTRCKMNDPNRFKFDARDYWLRSRDEIESAFVRNQPDLPFDLIRRACDETLAFAERCSAKVQAQAAGRYLVAPPLPSSVRTYDEFLSNLCKLGVRDRFGMNLEDLPDEYLHRVIHELRTIRDLGFASYFVAVWEVRSWARDAGILSGPGRGSAAGSLVSYLLRITDLDPVRHGLFFERFLAPGRRDLPDIDLDFESSRRDEVIDFLRDTYGEDRVAHISTHNTMGGKRALRDLGRIYSIPESKLSPVAGLIPDGADEAAKGGRTLSRTLKGTALGRKFAKAHPEIASVADHLEGQLRDIGIHAAGVVVASEPLADIVPIETRPRGGGPRVKAVAYDMKGTEAMGLVKLDVLGLRTLSTMSRAFELSGTSPEDIDLEDAEALSVFTDGRFSGVFQYDTPSARRLCRGFEFRTFSDIAVMTALNRPGPMKSGLAKAFKDRASGIEETPSVDPIYDEVFAETHGVPVYQEQVVELVRKLCGYTAEEGDKFRKQVAKKLDLSGQKKKFVAGAGATGGMSAGQAEEIFDSLTGFAQYAFNKAHAYSYAAVALWSAWLKARHPAAFFAAALDTEPDTSNQLRIASDARAAGIPVHPPTINSTSSSFVVRDLPGGGVEIVGSIGDLKGVGSNTAKAIARRAPFSSLLDFYQRTAGDGVRVTVKTFEILARATAFRDVFPNSKALVNSSRETWDKLKKGVEPEASKGDFTEAEIVGVVSEVWPLFVGEGGRSSGDEALGKIKGLVDKRRPIVSPGDRLDDGFAILFGRLAKFRQFPNDRGGKRGLALVSGARGGEQSVTVDEDVMSVSADALATTDKFIVAAVTCNAERQSARAVRIWTFEEAVKMETPDLAFLLNPSKTKPKDAGRSLIKADPGSSFAVQGVVLRARRHLDKSGRDMLTLGLMSERGFIRVFVFSQRATAKDVKKIKVGVPISMRVRKLESGTACHLTDGKISLGVSKQSSPKQ